MFSIEKDRVKKAIPNFFKKSKTESRSNKHAGSTKVPVSLGISNNLGSKISSDSNSSWIVEVEGNESCRSVIKKPVRGLHLEHKK